MDIASTLLTKKAALIGGGTAATTTAVVVPLTISKSEKKEITSREGNNNNKKETDNSTIEDPDKLDPENKDKELENLDSKEEDEEETTDSQFKFSALLKMSDDFFKDFNKPGDCVKKMYPEIKKDTFFTSKELDENDPGELVQEKQIFDQSNVPELGCYIINWKPDEKTFRVELSVKNDSKGWVWMSAIKPKSETEKNKLHLWFKEFILEKSSETWSVTVGQEGFLENYSPEFPKWRDKFKHTEGTDKIKEINPENQEECTGSEEESNCKDLKAKIAYWKKDDNAGGLLMHIGSNSGRHIVPWGTDNERNKKANRTKIYVNNKWHKDNHNNPTEVRKLLTVNNDHFPKKKGTWFTLKDYCNEEKQNDVIYTTFCATK